MSSIFKKYKTELSWSLLAIVLIVAIPRLHDVVTRLTEPTKQKDQDPIKVEPISIEALHAIGTLESLRKVEISGSWSYSDKTELDDGTAGVISGTASYQTDGSYALTGTLKMIPGDADSEEATFDLEVSGHYTYSSKESPSGEILEYLSFIPSEVVVEPVGTKAKLIMMLLGDDKSSFTEMFKEPSEFSILHIEGKKVLLQRAETSDVLRLSRIKKDS